MIAQTAQPVLPLPAWAIPLVTAMATAVLSDLYTYSAARKANPAAQFDWVLFCIKIIIGLLTGLTGGVGATLAN